jgi:hypothetical protein
MKTFFDELFFATKKAYPKKSGQEQQKMTQEIWARLKDECEKDKAKLENKTKEEIRKMEILITQNKGTLLHFLPLQHNLHNFLHIFAFWHNSGG